MLGRPLIAFTAAVAVACACEQLRPPRDRSSFVDGESAESGDRLFLPERSSLRIEIEEIGRLSFAGLPRAPDALAQVFRLPSGGWGVTSETFDGLIQLFDWSMTPAGTLGRNGSGPGEFQRKIRAVASGADLYVIDTGNARLSRFDSSLAFLDSRRLPSRVVSIFPAREAGTLLVSGLLPAFPESTYAEDATHSAGFKSVGLYGMDLTTDVVGGEVPEYRDEVKLQLQHAAMTGSGEVWTIAWSGGAIDVLTSDLVVTGRFRLPLDRYIDPPADRSARSEPPAPEVTGITSDGDQILWILVGIPDEDWSSDLSDDLNGVHALFDTFLIAIDALDRQIVATERLDPLCFPVHFAQMSCVLEADQQIRLMKVQLADASQ